jgi:hypothetical protein
LQGNRSGICPGEAEVRGIYQGCSALNLLNLLLVVLNRHTGSGYKIETDKHYAVFMYIKNLDSKVWIPLLSSAILTLL